MDIYKFAAQHGLRFPSSKGDLTVEQLFQLPLQSKTGPDLDQVAIAIDNKLEKATTKSFVADPSSNPTKIALGVALDVVKDVITTKQAENKAVMLKRQRAEQKQKLSALIDQKKDETLSKASIEELQKQIDALGSDE